MREIEGGKKILYRQNESNPKPMKQLTTLRIGFYSIFKLAKSKSQVTQPSLKQRKMIPKKDDELRKEFDDRNRLIRNGRASHDKVEAVDTTPCRAY